MRNIHYPRPIFFSDLNLQLQLSVPETSPLSSPIEMFNDQQNFMILVILPISQLPQNRQSANLFRHFIGISLQVQIFLENPWNLRSYMNSDQILIIFIIQNCFSHNWIWGNLQNHIIARFKKINFWCWIIVLIGSNFPGPVSSN